MGQLEFGDYTVTTSSENKIFFPKANLTKGDLINYYKDIGSIMVKYLYNRPVMLQRYPNGINEKYFYQKNSPDYFPDWIKTIKVQQKDNSYTNYVICQNTATLVYLANQGTITFHPWLSLADKLDYPDKIIFDLDPSTDDFSLVKKTAYLFKTLLEKINIEPFVMTTGSKGLHVVIPIERDINFDVSKRFATKCAEILLQAYPEMLTMELRKNKRGDKIFLDTLRNEHGATAVAPYSVRGKPYAPVATPLFWDELEEEDLDSQKYNIENIFKRLEKIGGDPWADMDKKRVSIKKILEKKIIKI